MRKIAFISQPEYFRFIYERDLDDVFEVREFPFTFGKKAGDFAELEAFDPDHAFFFRGEFFPAEVLNRLRGNKVALSSEPFPRKVDGKWEYSVDSIRRFLAFRSIRGKRYDYVFHYDESSKDLFLFDKMNLSGFFHFPVATKTYKPNIEVEKEWDLFFIGRSTAHREKLFGSLKHHRNFLHIAHGIWGPDLARYINASSICINAHAEDEVSWEPRLQMLLACGAFVLSEKITPNRFLKPGRDFVEYSGVHDLIDKVHHYLNHPLEMQTIRDNAANSIRDHFDSVSRFSELIRKMDSGGFPKFRRNGDGHGMFSILGKVIR